MHLGYRLGHVKGNVRVFRALVYNKGAAVLHMLRRLLGDDVFFAGLRRFYADRRYQKAGTDDLERALEAESGRVLDRFFERWIYGTDIPRVRYSTTLGDGDRQRAVRAGRRSRLRPARHGDPHLRERPDARTSWSRSPRRSSSGRFRPTDLVRQVQVNRDFGGAGGIRGEDGSPSLLN